MIAFKPLEKSDIEIIVQMQVDFYAIDNYPIDYEVTKKLFFDFIQNKNYGKAWLILENKNPIGYVILTFCFMFEYQGMIGVIDELYLTEAARGKGLGAKTIDYIQAKAKELKLKIIYLEVENHNENAQKLYIASDFIFHHRKLMKYIIK